MIDEIVGFFAKRPKADMLFFSINGIWGYPWTIPGHDSSGGHRIAEQYIKMRADGLRHAEHVCLERGSGKVTDAVVITDLPVGRQVVMDLGTGSELYLANIVESPTLVALREAVEAAVGNLKLLTV